MLGKLDHKSPKKEYVKYTFLDLTEFIDVRVYKKGDEVEITPFTCEIYSFFVDERQLQSEIVGKFTQYPLMLA
jgi:hypothetical protein